MFLKRLCLEKFRNFEFLDINFNDGLNLITGLNGQGKTSILESIYYSALTKSFRTNNDKNAIKYDYNFFNIKSNFISYPVTEKYIRVYFSNLEGKNLFINDKKISKFSEFIGTIPCVILTLDDLKICYGAPSIRRKFLDVLLSQVSPTYLESLKYYKRILQQRNALLNNENKHSVRKEILAWDEQLVNYGIQIILKRRNFIEYLNKNLNINYSNFSISKDKIKVLYKSSFLEKEKDIDIDDIKDKFYKKLKEKFDYEYEKKASFYGPHRDDIDFYMNNKSFKEFSSQGENKTLIIILKFLEWEYLSAKIKIRPILLLDDVFGELDEYRRKALLEYFYEIGQTFITTTSNNKFKDFEGTRLIVKNSKIYDA